MSFPKLVARYIAEFENPKGLSYPQLLALHVAAKYKLRSGIGGWLADIPRPPRAHAPSTIKSLLRRGWLEGNSWGVKEAMGDGDDTYPEDTPKLWISAKGKTLIEEIAIESGWVFDPKCENPTHPGLIRNRAEYRSIQAKGEEEMDVEKDSIDLGTFDDWCKASLACDQAAILLYGDDAQTYSSYRLPKKILTDDVIRQISALKEVDRPTVLAKLKEAGLLDFL